MGQHERALNWNNRKVFLFFPFQSGNTQNSRSKLKTWIICINKRLPCNSGYLYSSILLCVPVIDLERTKEKTKRNKKKKVWGWLKPGFNSGFQTRIFNYFNSPGFNGICLLLFPRTANPILVKTRYFEYQVS